MAGAPRMIMVSMAAATWPLAADRRADAAPRPNGADALAGPARNEIQNAMMHPGQTPLREYFIRPRREGAEREVEQLDGFVQ